MTETDAASAGRDAAVLSRRDALRAAGGAVVATSTLGAASTGVRAQSAGTDLESWFENTTNYDGVVDRTGESGVTVEVGVEANEGAFGFGPAAIRIDPGTTVTWSWTGKGGSHNVAHTDGDFESDLVDSADHTFEHTFESEGTYAYSCTPHEMMGMKGAVVVGGSAAGGGGGSGGDSDGESGGVAAPFGDSESRRLGGLALGGAFAAALASPGLFGAFLWWKDRDRDRSAAGTNVVPGSTRTDNSGRERDEAA